MLALLNPDSNKTKMAEVETGTTVESTATAATHSSNFVLREKVISYMDKYKSMTADARKTASEEIKEEIGSRITTGF